MHRLTSLAAALALCAGAADAGAGIAAAAASARTEWNPPARYDRPYTGTLYLIRLPPEQARGACAVLLDGITAHPVRFGCARRVDRDGTRHCIVITLDQERDGVTPEAHLRHELGHCNGWPAHHPE